MYTYGNAGYLGDGLHPFHTANGDLRDPEGARDMGPLVPCPRAFHSTTLAAEIS